MVQNMVVSLIVGCCFVYTLWTLAPKAPRSRVATVLLKLPLPLLLQKPLMAAARQQGGCGCDGCDRSAVSKKPPSQADRGWPQHSEYQPVTFVRSKFSKKTPP